jgi:hypothetical protein
LISIILEFKVYKKNKKNNDNDEYVDESGNEEIKYVDESSDKEIKNEDEIEPFWEKFKEALKQIIKKGYDTGTKTTKLVECEIAFQEKHAYVLSRVLHNENDQWAPCERKFWNELTKTQIVLKLPDDADKSIYMLESLYKYMKVEGNKIVLSDNVMINSEDKLIFCDGNSVIESGERITINFIKFLHFCKMSDGIVYGIKTQDILIKKLYLQMIKKIELN